MHTRGVRVCKVTAPVGASLISLLDSAKTTASPAGCVNSVEVSAGEVTAIDDVSPANADESWLVRLDRGPQAIASEQPIDFGDVVSVRLGATPSNAQATTTVAGPAGTAGSEGSAATAVESARTPASIAGFGTTAGSIGSGAS